MTNTDKHWFPVKVSRRNTLAIFSTLLKKGYKVYLPLIRYTVKRNDKAIWKIKPMFKGIIFINCKSEDLSQLQLIESSIKPFYNNRKPDFVKDTHIHFIKKVFSANELIEVIPKEINSIPYINIETEEFGSINLMKSYYSENDVIIWLIPIIKYSLVFNRESSFLKYIILESQDFVA